MATPGSLFTATPLGHEDNLELTLLWIIAFLCTRALLNIAGTFDPTLPRNRWPGENPTTGYLPTGNSKCKSRCQKETAPSQDHRGEGDCVENNEENGCVAFFLPK
ncbi:hypothetical protein TNCV_5047721 [Trichonephila clavipes]|nr:hypothetical protein TNCV_5047721 [Trichonephila clavipes]